MGDNTRSKSGLGAMFMDPARYIVNQATDSKFDWAFNPVENVAQKAMPDWAKYASASGAYSKLMEEETRVKLREQEEADRQKEILAALKRGENPLYTTEEDETTSSTALGV